MKAHAFCDGSGGSPLGSSCAAVLMDAITGELIDERSSGLPVGTNNVAEYEGLLLALDLAHEHGVTDLQVFSDSQLIVNQVMENWDVKNEALRPLRDAAWEAGSSFESLSITWIKRELNGRADALCTRELKNTDSDLPAPLHLKNR